MCVDDNMLSMHCWSLILLSWHAACADKWDPDSVSLKPRNRANGNSKIKSSTILRPNGNSIIPMKSFCTLLKCLFIIWRRGMPCWTCKIACTDDPRFRAVPQSCFPTLLTDWQSRIKLSLSLSKVRHLSFRMTCVCKKSSIVSPPYFVSRVIDFVFP